MSCMRLFLLSLVGLAGLAAAAPLAAAPADFFADALWRSRVLVVAGGADLRAAQRAAFAGRRAGLCARDMVVVEIAADSVRVDGVAVGLDARETRRHLAIDGPAVLLLGKDGGVKLRRLGAVPAERIFALIDDMPLRRAEARQPRSDCS